MQRQSQPVRPRPAPRPFATCRYVTIHQRGRSGRDHEHGREGERRLSVGAARDRALQNMLLKVRKHLTDPEIDYLIKSLEEIRKKADAGK